MLTTLFWQQLIQALSYAIPALCVLLLCHFLRRAIGPHTLHISMGVLLLFSILQGLPNFALNMQLNNMTFSVNFSYITFAVFTVLLMIYEIHGTTEAQRCILGLFIALLFTTVFISFTANGFSAPLLFLQNNHVDLLRFVENLKECALILIITHLIFMVSLPIVYQSLRNFKCPVSLALLACNGLILIGREMNLLYFFPAMKTEHTVAVWMVRLLPVLVVSIIGTGYLKLIPDRNVETRKAFSIITSLFSYLQSTDKLRQSSAEWAEKYQAVLNHSSELIFLVDPQGNIINANPAAFRVLGEQLNGQPKLADFMTDSDHVPFVPPKTTFSFSLEETTDEQPIMCNDMILTPPAPAKPLDVDVNLTKATINGDPVFVLIARNVTKQREQERQKAELQEQLYHAQRLESLGLLAGGVAHDFNNMLHSIQGSTEIIRRNTPTQSIMALLDNIDDATARASTLTRQLLGFARKGNYNVELIDVEKLVRQTASLFKPIAGNIAFKTLIEPGQLFSNGDFVQLQQVLLNLLINAKDAFPPDTERPRIVLRAEHLRPNTPEAKDRPQDAPIDQEYLCLKVKDNASGIPPEIIKNIFEPFYTTKAVGKGTGMGLAMAYGCVTSCKGWIHVESTLGQGTEFSVVLPEAQEV